MRFCARDRGWVVRDGNRDVIMNDADDDGDGDGDDDGPVAMAMAMAMAMGLALTRLRGQGLILAAWLLLPNHFSILSCSSIIFSSQSETMLHLRGR